LYIQLDNTASDNKNHHVLEFCSFLVGNGYFEEVLISTSTHFFNFFFLHTLTFCRFALDL
jgi:hypothetical protein